MDISKLCIKLYGTCKMQLKIVAYSILFTCLVCPLSGKSLLHKGCYECQEEVWEEVLCGSLPHSTTTVASKLPTTPTTKQYTPATTPSPATIPSTLTSPEITTPTDPYKKCYNECKLGCKEFCRKVAQNPSEKQIKHQISEPVATGRIKSTYIRQRELIPRAEELSNSDNDNNSYAPSDTEENEAEDCTLPEPYPLPIEGSCEEESEDEAEAEPYHVPYYKDTNIPPNTYFAKPVEPLIEPIYGPYAITEATVNKHMHKFVPYLARPQQPPYHPNYSPPHSNADYDFPIPFEKLFTKISKSVHEPAHGIQISIDGSIGKISKPRETTYDPPAPVINYPLEQRATFAQYDDSFDAILRNVISSNPSHEAEAPY